MKKIVVFSGAGISAESGLKTFRDSDGLWENYNIEDVATPEAWFKNPELVLNFYNLRRRQVLAASPNEAHSALAMLETAFDIEIITQNIDDLHERSGSSKVLHLHGEILKSKSIFNEEERYPISGSKLNLGDKCKNNQQLRPDVVWFGEAVPRMNKAIEICVDADILIIVGTSMNVYPAANIIHHVPSSCKKYLIDPQQVNIDPSNELVIIKKKASIGIPILVEMLIKEWGY